MTNRIFRGVISSSILIFFACVVMMIAAIFAYLRGMVTSQLRVNAEYVLQGIETEGIDYFQNFSSDSIRVTWIAKDGAVIFDSKQNASQMTNHLDREEVQAAIKSGTGQSVRYSDTLSKQTTYYAVRAQDGTILRVSSTTYTVWMLLEDMLNYLIVILLVVIMLSALLASQIAKRITKPINEIDLHHPTIAPEYKELAPLIDSLNEQNRQTQLQIERLRRNQEEFRLITENMREGLIIVDADGSVLSRNTSAAKLFGEDIGEGRIREAMQKALAGAHEEQVLHLGESVYSVIANPVMQKESVTGAIVIILDVTEKEQRDTLRREFTSNVSHELKTPLTSIYGISEILMNGIVKPQDVKGFAKNIYDESGRLISLIDDIIRLSQLDENTLPLEKISVDLLELARDIAERLEIAASKRKVTISVRGDHATVEGVPAILDEMIYNLVDNAIKYNKENGAVVIAVADGQHPCVSVEDTGIGIPASDRNRVFERFYRVDKSHSRKIGGTGLGLSIVKHGAAFHGATVTLDSREHTGTTITIRF